MSDNEVSSNSNSYIFPSNEDCSDTSQYIESESESEERHNESFYKTTTDIPLTPFNMKKELEEGYFDRDGIYHWKKRPKYNDYWLDNISNYNIPNIQLQHNRSSQISKSEIPEEHDYKEIYKKILSYLKGEETVSQALCRLGKNSLTTIERLRLKRSGLSVDADNVQHITDLTGLANIVLTGTGDVDIYQKTFKDISENISVLENEFKKSDKTSSLPVTDSELDMFSDNFSEKEQNSFKSMKKG